MVTLQILVLSFLVRVRVSQQSSGCIAKMHPVFVSLCAEWGCRRVPPCVTFRVYSCLIYVVLYGLWWFVQSSYRKCFAAIACVCRRRCTDMSWSSHGLAAAHVYMCHRHRMDVPLSQAYVLPLLVQCLPHTKKRETGRCRFPAFLYKRLIKFFLKKKTGDWPYFWRSILCPKLTALAIMIATTANVMNVNIIFLPFF